MNYALLKELMKQAESYANSKIHMTGWNYREEYNKKFAELIVRECGEVAYKAFWDNPETVRGIHIKEKIKQQFGVEE